MTEIVTSGSMSGEGKRSDGLLGESDNERRRSHLAPPVLYVTALLLDSTEPIIHCSSGNFRQTGDAIRESPPHMFRANTQTRLLKIDFEGLRAIAGVDVPSDDNLPFPIAGLRSLTLAHDSSLNLVASGLFVLEPTGARMGGVDALEQTLHRLNRQADASVDEDHHDEKVQVGVFDDATAGLLKAFQQRAHLDPTGTLDAGTLRALDSALIGGIQPLLDESAVPLPHGASTETVSAAAALAVTFRQDGDRKSTRLNSSHQIISYAVFCLKKKKSELKPPLHFSRTSPTV